MDAAQLATTLRATLRAVANLVEGVSALLPPPAEATPPVPPAAPNPDVPAEPGIVVTVGDRRVRTTATELTAAALLGAAGYAHVASRQGRYLLTREDGGGRRVYWPARDGERLTLYHGARFGVMPFGMTGESPGGPAGGPERMSI